MENSTLSLVLAWLDCALCIVNYTLCKRESPHIKRVVKCGAVFIRENNKIDAMKTSMCFASDYIYFFLLFL